MARPVVVKITGNSDSAVKAINLTERELKNLDATAKGLTGLKKGLAGIGAAILAGGLLREGVDLLKESVGLASDLTETTSKIDTVFGKSSKGVQNWAKTTSAALSMTQTEILDTVSRFQLLLTNKGLDASAAKKWSEELTNLSADLASFFNVDPGEAADAIASALKGEMDPIEKFGVTLDDATLKAEAYAQGLYKGKGPLSAYAKAQAIHAQIVKQTSKAQGDLIRTQGSAANQLRQFEVNVESLKTTLGTAFTPLIEKYLPGINDWLKDINTEEFGKELGDKFLKFSDTVDQVFRNIKGWWDDLDLDSSKFEGFLDYIQNDFWPQIQSIGREFKSAFGEVDSTDVESALDGLASAAGTIAGGITTAFEAFNNLSPEAKENIALIIAAGAAFTLAKKNPIVKIGVDLVAGVVTNVASAVASSLTTKFFAQTMKVQNATGDVKGLKVWVTNELPGGTGTDLPDGKNTPRKGLKGVWDRFKNLGPIEWIFDAAALAAAVATVAGEGIKDFSAKDLANKFVKPDDLKQLYARRDEVDRRLAENAKNTADADAETRRENARALQAERDEIDKQIKKAKDKATAQALESQLTSAKNLGKEETARKNGDKKNADDIDSIETDLAKLRGRFIYYDPSRGTYSGGGELPLGRSAEGDMAVFGTGGGRGRQVIYQTQVVNNYPAPERVSDSIASSLRIARYMVGVA